MTSVIEEEDLKPHTRKLMTSEPPFVRIYFMHPDIRPVGYSDPPHKDFPGCHAIVNGQFLDLFNIQTHELRARFVQGAWLGYEHYGEHPDYRKPVKPEQPSEPPQSPRGSQSGSYPMSHVRQLPASSLSHTEVTQPITKVVVPAEETSEEEKFANFMRDPTPGGKNPPRSSHRSLAKKRLPLSSMLVGLAMLCSSYFYPHAQENAPTS